MPRYLPWTIATAVLLGAALFVVHGFGQPHPVAWLPLLLNLAVVTVGIVQWVQRRRSP